MRAAQPFRPAAGSRTCALRPAHQRPRSAPLRSTLRRALPTRPRPRHQDVISSANTSKQRTWSRFTETLTRTGWMVCWVIGLSPSRPLLRRTGRTRRGSWSRTARGSSAAVPARPGRPGRRRVPSWRSTTRPTSLSTLRCRETAGRLTGTSAASYPTDWGPSSRRSMIACRAAAPQPPVRVAEELQRR